MLKIEDLRVEIDGQEIVKGLDLEVGKGEIHAIMGPNGSGKSTLANVLMGHPRYEVTEGSITFQGEDAFELEPDERAKLGMFLAFQYPSEVPGVSVANFLRTAVNSVREEELSPMEMYRLLQEKMSIMQMDPKFAERYLNEGFSGGEKKRNEILQMLMLDPKLAIMDETDSGLDIDALQVVAKGVNEMKGPEFSAVIITHYQRILRYIEPDRVHVMLDGRLVTSGGKELADDLEEKGYDWVRQEFGAGTQSEGRDERMPEDKTIHELGLDEYKYGFRDPEEYFFRTPRKGIDPEIVAMISKHKNEPEWMLEFRLKALESFFEKPTPTWGGDLSEMDYDDIYYYIKPMENQGRSWDDVPDDIKNTFEKLGIPQAERESLAGVGAQYESEVVYHSLKKELEEQGVIFLDMDSGLREHEDIVEEYFGTIIPPDDNKFAALNSAVWSGGSFVYIPPGVSVDIPLQAYFRINAENMGQFERTLIIADEDSYVHYIEGCTAPTYTSNSLHSAVVELIAKPGARIRYSTIQNWSHNTYNLVTKRGAAYENATIEWVDGNLGSRLTMKYPAVYLMGEGARGEILSVAYAGDGQHQDAGGKVVHAAPNTSSLITSKSISKGTGRSTYRGLLKVYEGAENAKSRVECDALLLDEKARTDTIPYIEIEEDTATVAHEATVGKIGEEQLFYLMSRGLDEAEALSMIVLGFMEPFTRELPMEYAVELNRLIQMEMEGSVG